MAAALSDNQLVEQLAEFGMRLSRCPSSAPELLNLLDELELLFSKMKQSPRPIVRQALLIPTAVLMEEDLFKHSDTNVRITVASCLNEATRVCAPDAPFDDDKMRDIFELIVSSFEYLSCEPGRCYSKAVLILQSVARLRSCVMMLDLDCDSLVVKMFELFQRNASPKHPQAVTASMVKIMSVMIQETDTLSPELLKVLLDSIKIEKQGVSPVSWEMGVKVLEGCAEKLKPAIMETVSSMGYSLEDYAPILSSICKPVVDTVAGVSDDSSIPVNNEPSGNPNDVENVKSLKATESSRTTSASSSGLSGSKALVIGGTASERRKKPNSHTLDKEAGGLEHNQLGDSSTKKARPTKKDNPGVSGNKPLRKKNDVPGVSSSSGKKLPKQQEISGGSGSKSKTGQTKKDKFQSNDSSKKPRKRVASSDDDDDVIETPHGRKTYKEDLVGSRIKVWWPLDRRYYEGTITSYDAYVRKHRVDYDDGDEENLNLRKERWELLGDEAPVDIASLLGKKTARSPPIMPRQEAPIEEKKIGKTDDDEKRKTPTSDVESGDARENTTTTVVKSEISESLPEKKKAKLSDGQSSS